MSREVSRLVIPMGIKEIQISVDSDGLVVVENANQVCVVRDDNLKGHEGFTLGSRTMITTTMLGSEVSTCISRSHGSLSGGVNHPEMRMYFPHSSERDGRVEISFSHMPTSIPLYPPERVV